ASAAAETREHSKGLIQAPSRCNPRKTPRIPLLRAFSWKLLVWNHATIALRGPKHIASVGKPQRTAKLEARLRLQSGLQAWAGFFLREKGLVAASSCLQLIAR